MDNKRPRKVSFFYRDDNEEATSWALKIKDWIEENCPDIEIEDSHPDALIVLGGDGTVLEAARTYNDQDVLIFGLNLGHFGFLTSVREEDDFLKYLKKFLNGNYWVVERMMMEVVVERGGDKIFSTNALNDLLVENPFGMVDIDVAVDGHVFQNVRGTGALVATATGSTAYNLSAHGPIVMPNLECLVISEILDHNIPTPPLVVDDDREISFEINHFRKRGQISITETDEEADVVLISDGEVCLSLEMGDVVKVRRSDHSVEFAETEKNHFLKSVQDKFSFK